MDLTSSGATGGKAAAAGTSARRAFLVLCGLLVANMYVSPERSRAALEARLAQARPLAHQSAARQARQGGAAAAGVRGNPGGRQAGGYCGQANGGPAGGAEVQFKDGARIFVCGPALHD